MLFEVVAIDDQDGTIEIQHFDGTIEESEPEGWISMRADPVEAPEDWSGSVDINTEDLPGAASQLFVDWQSQLETIEDFEPTEDPD